MRVEANRLRRRLAEYYAGEGASNRLQISIPLGQYVPSFKLDSNRKASDLPGAPVAERPQAAWVGSLKGRQRFLHPILRGWWSVAIFALLLLLFGFDWRSLRQEKQPPPVEELNQPSAASGELQFGPPVGEEVRILAGARRSFVDHAGKLWSADTWFDGGNAERSSVLHVSRTQDPGFYRTSRQGQFRYKIPLKKGIYELRLHFAETEYGPESNATGGEGSRIMIVRANGRTLLSHFDIVADAGGGGVADVKVFPDITPASDGFLYIEFSGEDGKQAILSAIEILPGVRNRIRPVRVLARQTPYYSNDSHWWSPDDYFEGGQMAAYTTPVGGTDDPELLETERWGNFSYAIPVSPGKYSVALYFAVRHGAWDQPAAPSGDNSATVAHVFNVFCNGTVLLENFNLGKEARQTDVVLRKFTGIQPNAQGKLLLSFVPVEGYATVTGIEVIPQ